MRVKHDYLLRDMGDQHLVIPVGEETRSFRGFVRLNDTGAYLWGLLEQDMTREDLAQALTRRWGVDDARVIWRGLPCEGWACDEAGKEHAPDARVRRLAPDARVGRRDHPVDRPRRRAGLSQRVVDGCRRAGRPCDGRRRRRRWRGGSSVRPVAAPDALVPGVRASARRGAGAHRTVRLRQEHADQAAHGRV